MANSESSMSEMMDFLSKKDDYIREKKALALASS